MVSVSETLPAYSPEALVEQGMGSAYDLDAKQHHRSAQLDGPGGFAEHGAPFGAAEAAAPYVMLDQSALDVQTPLHFNPFNGGFSPALGQQHQFQHPQTYVNQVGIPGQLNPNQPAFTPSFQNLSVGFGGGEMPYSPDPSSPGSAFGSSPAGYMDIAPTMYQTSHGFAQASPLSPNPSYAGSPLPQQQLFGSPFPAMYGPTPPYVINNDAHLARTVYVGNLPSTASVDELLNLVRFGPIDNVKILPERSCAFISFLDPTIAAAFHSDMITRRTSLHGNELKIGWGKNVPMIPQVMDAVQRSGATRNVYLGNLDDDITEQSLRDDLSRFGPIDQVKIVRDKNIGFVHFLSIANAIKVVQALPQDPHWFGKRVNYGKDRCAYVPKNQHQQQAHNLAAAQMAASYTGGFGINLNLPNGGMAGFPGAIGLITEPENLGNRTVYLGNLHPDTSVEEICNAIRGGILQQVRYIPEKHICFVTFVDPNAALAFYTMSMHQGVNIHQRRLKIGWGKHSGPPPPGISMVVQAGGSRNIYIGNIADFDEFNEDRLRSDFGVHGDIELVNLLREKNCAFVNFTQISFAIKALEAIKQDPAYVNLKVAYGKDRCGNLPRQGFGLGRAMSDRSRGSRRSPGSSTGPPATPSPPLVKVDGLDLAAGVQGLHFGAMAGPAPVAASA